MSGLRVRVLGLRVWGSGFKEGRVSRPSGSSVAVLGEVSVTKWPSGRNQTALGPRIPAPSTNAHRLASVRMHLLCTESLAFRRGILPLGSTEFLKIFA